MRYKQLTYVLPPIVVPLSILVPQARTLVMDWQLRLCEWLQRAVNILDMKSLSFLNQDCAVLKNDILQLLVSRSIGPRILSLRFHKGRNLLAELPDLLVKRPDGKPYHFYGGHRLWLSPEDPIRSYGLDDKAVEISQTDEGLLVRKQVEPDTGFEKSILLTLEPDKARLTLTHRLTNCGPVPIECAPWTITQFRTGGVALLPQARTETGLLPNRTLSLWPYADISSQYMSLKNEYILLRAEIETPFKIGFPNPRGWLAYWLESVLFVKRATFDKQRRYPDFGCSSECYCNRQFLELETLGPISWIEPGASSTHVETWELYPDIPEPKDDETVRSIAEKIGLE